MIQCAVSTSCIRGSLPSYTCLGSNRMLRYAVQCCKSPCGTDCTSGSHTVVMAQSYHIHMPWHAQLLAQGHRVGYIALYDIYQRRPKTNVLLVERAANDQSQAVSKIATSSMLVEQLLTPEGLELITCALRKRPPSAPETDQAGGHRALGA